MQAKERKLASEEAIEQAYAAYVAALVARGPKPAPKDDDLSMDWPNVRRFAVGEVDKRAAGTP
ncbi:hypothetical protein [Pseudoduganella sp. OTU4001]|uniref:hypothetical protein n=1 Tax=Pseudoduganella sp. OTU4001 TaxID=3043854 RepID=UPI00313E6EEF